MGMTGNPKVEQRYSWQIMLNILRLVSPGIVAHHHLLLLMHISGNTEYLKGSYILVLQKPSY